MVLGTLVSYSVVRNNTILHPNTINYLGGMTSDKLGMNRSTHSALFRQVRAQETQGGRQARGPGLGPGGVLYKKRSAPLYPASHKNLINIKYLTFP